MMGESVLTVREAGVRYRRVWALRHSSFELVAGGITALVGPNGAGKSTLMMAAAGLLTLTEGSVQVFGASVRTSPAHPDLGYLAQDKPLYRQASVQAMLRIGQKLNARWDAALAQQLCDEAGLDRRARVRTLSSGQRTRLALALVLARRPRVLLLDEPLADLDPLARLEVQQMLLAQVADTGMTVLMSSHILGEIEDACDDLLILTDGRIGLHDSIEGTIARHVLLIGPGRDEAGLAGLPAEHIVQIQRAPRQVTVLLDGPAPQLADGWTIVTPTLEEVVVARLRGSARKAAA